MGGKPRIHQLPMTRAENVEKLTEKILKRARKITLKETEEI